MGRAMPLTNFRELAVLEEKEPKMVDMLNRFETERSDIILQNIQDSLSFMRFFGDVANLYFPVMMDTLLMGGKDPFFSAEDGVDETLFLEEEENKEESEEDQANSPDQGGDIDDNGPAGGGPSLI